jgi:hypothetical protein
MALALAATAIVALACFFELGHGRLGTLRAGLGSAYGRRRARRRDAPLSDYDPGRERRAEQRARALLESCVNEEEWAMYRDLGFLRVWGSAGAAAGGASGGRYGYLIYPHRPLVAFLADTGTVLNEYCVALHAQHWSAGQVRLPDSDDVLAKWMMLTADERQLLGQANMHLPGRQVDPGQVQRDLGRLAQWEAERAARPSARAVRGGAGELGGTRRYPRSSVPAP